jgi:flagellar protein FlaG
MSIQSLNGSPGSTPQPAQTRGSPAPAAEPTVKLPAAPVKQSAAPLPQKHVEQAIERLKAAMPAKASALTFSLDDKTGSTIVRIVDSETGDLIRQIPSKELVEIAHALDKAQGKLLNQKA